MRRSRTSLLAGVLCGVLAALAQAGDLVRFYGSRGVKGGASFLARVNIDTDVDLRVEPIELLVEDLPPVRVSKGARGLRVTKSRAVYKRPRGTPRPSVRSFDFRPGRGKFKMTVDELETRLQPPPDTLLTFGDVILRGVGPAYDPDDPQGTISLWRPFVVGYISGEPVVLRTAEEYETYMSAVEHQSAAYPTDVNFETHIVLAVNGEQFAMRNGLDVRVRSVIEESETTPELVCRYDVRRYEVVNPDVFRPECDVLFPLHVVAVPRSDLPVRFEANLLGPFDPCTQ